MTQLTGQSLGSAVIDGKKISPGRHLALLFYLWFTSWNVASLGRYFILLTSKCASSEPRLADDNANTMANLMRIVNLFYYRHINYAAGNILSFVKIIPRGTTHLSDILDPVF